MNPADCVDVEITIPFPTVLALLAVLVFFFTCTSGDSPTEVICPLEVTVTDTIMPLDTIQCEPVDDREAP